MQTALKLSQDDQNTIANLKREIEKAWKMVDASHEKEARAKETIGQLKTEISNLSRLVEQGAGLSVGQENTVTELMREKDELTAERDAQIAQIANLRAEIGTHLSSIRQREAERSAAGAEIQGLKEEILVSKAEQVRDDSFATPLPPSRSPASHPTPLPFLFSLPQERELRRRERLEKESKDIKTVMEMRATELKARSSQLDAAATKAHHLEENLKGQKGKTDKMVRELEATKGRLQKAEADLKEQLSLNQGKLAENSGLQAEVRRIDGEIGQLYQETLRATKAKDALLKRLKAIDAERAALKKESETIRSQGQSLEREIDVEKKEAASAKTQAAEVREELEELRAALDKAADSTSRQVAITKLNQRMIKDLEGEIASFKSESAKQRKMLYTLEKASEGLPLTFPWRTATTCLPSPLTFPYVSSSLSLYGRSARSLVPRPPTRTPNSPPRSRRCVTRGLPHKEGAPKTPKSPPHLSHLPRMHSSGEAARDDDLGSAEEDLRRRHEAQAAAEPLRGGALGPQPVRQEPDRGAGGQCAPVLTRTRTRTRTLTLTLTRRSRR